MRILKIKIENYRSCSKMTFEPDEHLSALIGPNGSGKTNILSAIKLLSLLTTSRRRRGIRESMTKSPCILKTWFDIDGKEVIHTAKINLVTNERNQDEVLDSDESWYMRSITGNRKRIKIPIGIFSSMGGTHEFYYWLRRKLSPRYFDDMVGDASLNKPAISALFKIGKFVDFISYYSASEFTNPSNCPISFEVEGDEDRRRGISIRGHRQLLFDMYQKKISATEKFKEYLDIIGPQGIGLVEDIGFNEIETSSSNYSVLAGGEVKERVKVNLLVVPSFHVLGNKLSPSQLSEGTFKTIALVFYLITDSSSLLMIEEPEVCVHHGLLSSMVELIKICSKEKQIVISTHSDSVLDDLSLSSVFRVERTDDHGTKITNIRKTTKGKELEALKYYLDNEGTLGEFWKHGDLE